MKLYSESINWLGWMRDITRHPDLVATGFGQFANDRRAVTKNWQVLLERAHHALRGKRFVRFQLFGYSRLDDYELMEIQAFLTMLRDLAVMPKEKQLGKPAPDFQNMVHCWYHEPNSGPGQGRHFATVQADIFDLTGVEELIDAMQNLRGINRFI